MQQKDIERRDSIYIINNITRFLVINEFLHSYMKHFRTTAFIY